MDLAELAYRYKNANTDAEKAELKAKLAAKAAVKAG